MGIIIEDREFDPVLRNRIAAFIDALFEEPGFDGGFSHEVQEFMMDAAAAAPARTAASSPAAYSASAPAVVPASSELPHSSRRRSPGMFGRVLESFDWSRKSDDVVETDDAAEATEATEAADAAEATEADERMCFGAAAPSGGSSDLKTWLDQVDEPFSTTLLALIDRKGLSDVDVYKRAHMSRQLFSRIRSDASYRPAKKTVLALAIALGLSLDEMRDLLERAGFALSRSNKRDLIVEYFVTNGVYDLFAINEALYEFDQPLI